MIMDYVYALFGVPETPLESALLYGLGIYLTITLFKWLGSAIFRVFGITERRRY